MQVFRHVYIYQYILFINLQLTTELKAIAKLSTPYLTKCIQAKQEVRHAVKYRATLLLFQWPNFCIKFGKTIWVKTF